MLSLRFSVEDIWVLGAFLFGTWCLFQLRKPQLSRTLSWGQYSSIATFSNLSCAVVGLCWVGIAAMLYILIHSIVSGHKARAFVGVLLSMSIVVMIICMVRDVWLAKHRVSK
jgi:fluoride ion exporter CrcB/FEX